MNQISSAPEIAQACCWLEVLAMLNQAAGHNRGLRVLPWWHGTVWGRESKQILGKIPWAKDFLIDGRTQKVVISNSSGNYSNLPAFH
jgi:hypothetical protein